MSLSQQEEEVLAGLAEALRADDPALADALSTLSAPPPPSLPVSPPLPAPAPPPVTAPLPVPLRDVVDLSAMLIVLIVTAVLRAAELDIAATAAVTCLLLVPWLILTAHAAERSPGDERRAPPLVRVLGRPVLGVALALGIVATLPRLGDAVLAAVITFVAVPCLVLRLLTWVERRTPGRPAY